MSLPTPEPRSTRKLVWASDEVIASIEREVQPRVSLPKRAALVATSAFVLAGLPAFVVLAAITVVAPSVTNEAGVGTAAVLALQFAILFGIGAVVTTLRPRAAKPDAADPDLSTRGTVPRVAIHALLTGACAWVVLAFHGLSTGKIALVTVVFIVVLNLLPVIVARLVHLGRRPGEHGPGPVLQGERGEERRDRQ